MSFVTELDELTQNNGDAANGLVHTHKLVRGYHPIASIANYGLHLAKKLRIPKKVLDSAENMVKLLRENDKILPEVNDDDMLKLNCLRLALTLRKLALKEDMDMSDKIEVALKLQEQFAAEDQMEQD